MVEDLLMKALAKDPNDRYQNTEEFARAIQTTLTILCQEQVLAAAPPPPPATIPVSVPTPAPTNTRDTLRPSEQRRAWVPLIVAATGVILTAVLTAQLLLVLH